MRLLSESEEAALLAVLAAVDVDLTLALAGRRFVCYRVPTAKPCEACGARCDFVRAGEPCWGQIEVGDEDDEGNWTHCCIGHWACVTGGNYEPNTEASQRGVAPLRLTIGSPSKL